jgi:hypothetical protein
MVDFGAWLDVIIEGLKAIVNVNSTLNGGYGWTILRSPPSGTASVDYIANHAFLQNGHLIHAWDSRQLSGFWNPYSV